MRLKSIFAILVFSTIGTISITAQKAYKIQGNTFFDAGKYKFAIQAYNSYAGISKEPALLIKRGVCYFHINQPDSCIRDMAAAHQLKSIDNRRFKYTAMSYFAKRDYLEAANFYKTYLTTLKPSSKEWEYTILQLKRCGFGKNLKYTAQSAFVENLGLNVNTEYDEFGPLQSPTQQGRYYFSSAREGTTGGMRDKKGLSDIIKGSFSADMFLVDLNNGNWSAVMPFEPLLNGPKHDLLQDFSNDGTVIYYIKSADRITGTLFSDTFYVDKNTDRLPVRADLPFNAERGDKDLFIFNDSMFLFSAVRDEGYGGYDLYYALSKNGIWQHPINLGPEINSEFNEISPFLLKGGNTLYFCADREETYGGFDIFYSNFTEHIGWSPVINAGPALNSPGDDVDIEISSDGRSAIFASDRIEGFGGFDLYMAYFKDQIIEQMDFVEVPDFIWKDNQDTEMEMAQTPLDIPVLKAEIPTRDFVNKPLFFTDTENVLNASNISQLKKLTELMTIYPDLKISLSSHYISEGNIAFDLYFSIKRAEIVADYMVKSGISPHRIYLQGLGSNYPLATPYINGISTSISDRVNKRIDVSLSSVYGEKLRVIQDAPVVSDVYRDFLWDDFMKLNEGVTFRVRFARVSQMLKSDLMAVRNDIIIGKKANEDKYVYTIGNVSTFTEAQEIITFLNRNNILDAEILPYYQGMPLSIEEINAKWKGNPVLDDYINEWSK